MVFELSGRITAESLLTEIVLVIVFWPQWVQQQSSFRYTVLVVMSDWNWICCMSRQKTTSLGPLAIGGATTHPQHIHTHTHTQSPKCTYTLLHLITDKMMQTYINRDAPLPILQDRSGILGVAILWGNIQRGKGGRTDLSHPPFFFLSFVGF